jgi:DeoR/GlpR family transcriptional regulator of sugar metabolism
MLVATRHSRIVEIVHDAGPAGCDHSRLATLLGVSESTVRRDVAALVRNGSLVRVRGGVFGRYHAPRVLPRDQVGGSASRLVALAREAVSRVRAGDRVGLGTGPGAVEIAHALALVPRLTVVTTSVSAADVLHRTRHPGLELVVLGGLPTSTDGVGGPITVSQLTQLRVDHLIVGASALERDAGLTSRDVMDGEALKAFAAVSDTVSVVAPAPAWGRVELFAVLPMTAVDVFVTDRVRSEDDGRASPAVDLDGLRPSAEHAGTEGAGNLARRQAS